jgi:uncharacterized protein (DUF934 family)
MTVIVTDTGFHPEDWTAPFLPLAELAASDTGAVVAVDLGPTDDPDALQGRIGRIDMIRVAFRAFNDGRGFTIARRLRALGYQGRLRAHGHVIADQYAMIRRAGFDEVEISADLATRQPQDQWLARANWRAHDYQARLRA